MSLISSPIPNFVNGISQQPYTLRLPSQGELQQNALSTVAKGLTKRPATEHLAKIGVGPVTSAHVHLINRDGSEQYIVVVTPGDLKVYDLAGVQKTVVFTNKTYLNTTLAADESFALTTVADYTFISNKSKTVGASSTMTPSRPFEALIHVKLGNYGKTYNILIDGVIRAAYTTPNGGKASESPLLSTEHIATQLTTALVNAGYNAGNWQTTRFGNTIYIKNTAVDFTVATEDGFSGTALVGVKRRLQKFADLPAQPRVDGFMVEIVGDQSSDFDNYWVRFNGQGSSNSGGVWQECGAPGISEGLDPLTMPHQLIRQADGTFTFGPADWTVRDAGDEGSNPHPSFVGRTINDVFFFKNRLGFLSDENFIMSETGAYFNLYRTTVTDLLDSDPVDVTAATNKVAILEHAVPFNKQLLLFSKQQQFLVDPTQQMTPKKVPIEPSTEFTVSTRAKPVASGKNVYFTSDKGRWSAVREFFVEGSNNTNDATDVASHVPSYVPSNVVKIAASPNEDVLVLLSDNARSKLFIYKYYFSGNEKLQSSWSEFTFDVGGEILSCDFIGSVLHLAVSRADGLYFERMNFAVGTVEAPAPYQVRLDRRKRLATSALSFDGTHTVIDLGALGYTPDEAETWMAVADGGGTIVAGTVFPVIVSGGTAKIAGNVTATALTFGRQYTMRYVLTTLTLKAPMSGGGTVSVPGGRTQVRRISFNYADSGYFKVLVTPTSRQTYEYPFSGVILAAPSAELGQQVFSEGAFSAPVMARNTEVEIAIESNQPTPVSILGADWEAYFVKRSRSV